jgi:glycosyltransferase involved in cell wall biosynthesis
VRTSFGDEIRVSHIALFLPSLAGGGVERVMALLANAFAERGHRVDVLLRRASGPYLQQLSPAIRVIGLRHESLLKARWRVVAADPFGLPDLFLPVLLPWKCQGTIGALADLARYLRRERPDWLLSAGTYPSLVALWARRLAAAPVRVAISEHVHLSRAIMAARRWRWRFLPSLVAREHPRADAIIAVSDGVADDLALMGGVPRHRIVTIHNPIVHADLAELSRARLDHPWFAAGEPPVVLGVGRLNKQKDFATLLDAFRRLCTRRQARLMILGEGRERLPLARQIYDLGLADAVELPGFVDNPFAYMERAAVFVLSSRYEGFGNVVAEALACGCPVVSTDCPSGPAEILDNGAYGRLVPVGEPAAMAAAISSVLDEPRRPERLRVRGAEFSVGRAAERYLELLHRDATQQRDTSVGADEARRHR